MSATATPTWSIVDSIIGRGVYPRAGAAPSRPRVDATSTATRALTHAGTLGRRDGGRRCDLQLAATTPVRRGIGHAAHDPVDILAFEDLVGEQGLRQLVELPAVCVDDRDRGAERLVGQLAHLHVELSPGRLRHAVRADAQRGDPGAHRVV